MRAGIQSGKRHRFSIVYRVFGRPAGDKITLEETDGTGAFVTFATLRGNERFAPVDARGEAPGMQSGC